MLYVHCLVSNNKKCIKKSFTNSMSQSISLPNHSSSGSRREYYFVASPLAKGKELAMSKVGWSLYAFSYVIATEVHHNSEKIYLIVELS